MRADGHNDMKDRSRGAPSCPSFAIPNVTTTAEPDLRQTAPVVGPLAVTIRRGCSQKRKAERRKALFRNLRAPTFILPRMRGRTQEGARRAPFVSFPPPLAGEGWEGARSPLGVPPRHLRQRPNATAQLEPRDFPGTVQSARPDGSKDGAHRNAFLREADGRLPCVTRGHYPRLAVPAQRDCTRRPVVMPVGRVLPKPPESRR